MKNFPISSGERLVERLNTEPFALSFAGQGFAWLPTVDEHPTVHGVVQEHLDAAARLLEPVSDKLAPFFPRGFKPIQWAREGKVAASDAAVSTPGILVAQVAVLESLKAQGLNPEAAVAHIGHSQGVLATFVSSGRASAAEVIALAQLIGAAVTATGRRHGLIRSAEGA